MSRRRTNDGNSPSTSGPNGLHEFFTGPVHLLILKVPLLIIGTIFFVAYLIVKHTIIQTGRSIYSAITSIPSALKSSMNYMISVYHKIPVYARYLGGWFYTKILLPIRFFVVNYLLSNTYRAIQWIGKTIVSLSVEFYRSILRPMGHFCYVCAVERFPQWIDDILGALSMFIRLFFTKMSSLCLWLWHNILHPFCSFIDRYLILPIDRVITKILSYICTEVIPAAAQLLKLMAGAARHWLNQLILHRNLILLRIARFIRDMTMMLFQRVVSPIYATVLTSISYAINEIVVPCCQWTIQTIETIAYQSFIALSRASIHISEAIIRLYQAILHIGRHCWLWLDHTVRKIYTFIVDDFFPAAILCVTRIARFFWACVNYLLRNMYLVSSESICVILDTTMLLYQRILSPMYALVETAISYTINEIVVPMCRWTMQMAKFISYHLFVALSRALIHTSETVIRLYRAILHIGRHCWLWLDHTVRKIYTFIVDDFFPAAILLAKRIARFIWTFVNHLIRNTYLVSSEVVHFIRDITMTLYQRVLSPVYATVVTSIFYAINEIVVPCCQWTIQTIKTIAHHSFIALSRALIHISETIIRLYQAILYIGRHYWLWLYHTIRKIYTLMVDDFFPAAILLAKRIARFIWTFVNYLIRNTYLVSSEVVRFIRDITMTLYQRVLSPMYVTVETAISYTINEIVVPMCRWTIQMVKTIFYHLFVALFRALIQLSNLIMHIYYTAIFVIQRYRSSLYDMLRKIWLLFYHKILPAGNQFMKRLMKTVWDFSNHLILYSRLILLQVIRFIRDSSTTLYKQILLPLYGTVVTLTIYITKEILQPLGKWTIQMVSVASTAVVSIVHTVIQTCYAAGLFCRHQGLQVCHTVVDAYWLIYGEIMKMISTLNMHIQPIVRFKFYERIFHPISGALYENGQIFYQSTLVPLGHAMSAMGPAIINLLNALKKMTSDGLYALRQAVVALSAALAAMFRAIIESSRRLLAQ